MMLAVIAGPQVIVNSPLDQANILRFKEDIKGLPIREFDVVIFEK
jgi:hypothetical protein